ncbi:MAG: hypothetical protein L6461_09595 [Anaerolineae bacterium]|nr:hypothetical protein [Anaerolineae bacterium]
MNSKLSGYTLVPHIDRRQAGHWPWCRSVCAKCGGKVTQLTLNIPRHAARELIENEILTGEAERLFRSTRDDLGWSVRRLVCQGCKQFAPKELHHAR